MTSASNDAGRAMRATSKDTKDTKDSSTKREDKRQGVNRGKEREVERKYVVVCHVLFVLSFSPMSLLSIVSNVGFQLTIEIRCQTMRK